MLFDLTFPCYLTTFSGKKCLSGEVICAIFSPIIEVLLYRSIPQKRRIGQGPEGLRFEDCRLYHHHHHHNDLSSSKLQKESMNNDHKGRPVSRSTPSRLMAFLMFFIDLF
jgi:hypothetical protein